MPSTVNTIRPFQPLKWFGYAAAACALSFFIGLGSHKTTPTPAATTTVTSTVPAPPATPSYCSGSGNVAYGQFVDDGSSPGRPLYEEAKAEEAQMGRLGVTGSLSISDVMLTIALRCYS